MMRQTNLGVMGGPNLTPDSSRFIRTTWMLDVKRTLPIHSIGATIRFLDSHEANKLEDLTRRRNVFARHSWENNFYLQRIREFANRSVIEVLRPGDPDAVADEADLVAMVVERVAVLCTVLYASRATLQNRLAITQHRKEVVDFIIGPGFNFLRSSSKRERGIRGVTIDERFVRRFRRLGLDVLIEQATQSNELSIRLRQGLQWLLESRLEPSLSAAVVKTAIALESLLGANEAEPLRRTLSERTAFFLSDDPDLRVKSSRVVRDFYDARSRVVHGSRGKVRGSDLQLLEAADRLSLLLAITLAANSTVFGSFDGAAKWVEDQRWGRDATITRPFRDGDLKRALARTAEG